jgi:hypothetical protein
MTVATFTTGLGYNVEVKSIFKDKENLKIEYSATDSVGHKFNYEARITKRHAGTVHQTFDVWYEGTGNKIVGTQYKTFNAALKFFKTKTIFKNLV